MKPVLQSITNSNGAARTKNLWLAIFGIFLEFDSISP
jgi:hypothetical protein